MAEEFWQTFLNGLADNTLLTLERGLFKPASGLNIADWERLNFDGISSSVDVGTIIPAALYEWADPQPDLSAPVYRPGKSLSDSFECMLQSISATTAGDLSTIQSARTKLAQLQMNDGRGNSWPLYRVSPGLNDFIRTSLQAVGASRAPAVDFTMIVDSAALPSGSEYGTAGGPSGAPPARLKIRFQAQAMQMFSVAPDRWFSELFLRVFADKIDPASALSGKKVLGPGGLIESRISQILVAFRRTVTVIGQVSALGDLRAAAELVAEPVAAVGFHFAAGPESTAASARDRVIFQDNTNAPYIIGFTVSPFA